MHSPRAVMHQRLPMSCPPWGRFLQPAASPRSPRLPLPTSEPADSFCRYPGQSETPSRVRSDAILRLPVSRDKPMFFKSIPDSIIWKVCRRTNPPARRPERRNVQNRQPDQQGHDPRPGGFLAVAARAGDVSRLTVGHKGGACCTSNSTPERSSCLACVVGFFSIGPADQGSADGGLPMSAPPISPGLKPRHTPRPSRNGWHFPNLPRGGMEKKRRRRSTRLDNRRSQNSPPFARGGRGGGVRSAIRPKKTTSDINHPRDPSSTRPPPPQRIKSAPHFDPSPPP